MRRFLSNPWVVTVVGTATGTMLATWLLALHWSEAGQSLRDWLSSDSHMPRYIVMLSAWLLLIAAVRLARLAYLNLKRERSARSAATSQEQPQTVKLAPDTFELTSPRRRALLALRNRVDARTTLYQLHELVADNGSHVDRQTTQAHVQHDMEAAERAGIVSIERKPGGYGDNYRLAIPDGRNWVLEHERELQLGASAGMDPKQRGPRYS